MKMSKVYDDDGQLTNFDQKSSLDPRMIIPCEKTFPWFHYFWHCDLDLGVWPIFLKTLTLLKTFDISQIRPFCGYHYFLPCDLDLDPLFERFNLAKNFWIVSSRAFIFTWAFLVTRSSYWYQNICPCDLGHLKLVIIGGHLCFTNTSC